MAKSGLIIDVATHAAMAMEARKKRDASTSHKSYLSTVKRLTKDIDATIKSAPDEPELCVFVSRECFRFTMQAMPDPAQDPGRATALSQCLTLTDCLAKVRQPAKYRAEMQEQFGPDLDPRNYPTSQDAFNSIIKSQKNRIYQEGKGFNSPVEQTFCRKRTDLLTAVEKGYDQLRDNALGIDKLQNKGRER
ncbi:MAG: hypothetical protein LBT47_12675 [Deltaproteobacteria bacterium]|jgi:hypothetical protein|nr:hypothetical protein [Deltaproteobacteria bacterium]